MANVTPIQSPYQIVADASDRVADLLTRIPGWEYEYSRETLDELLQAATLLRQAIPLLERASEREAGN